MSDRARALEQRLDRLGTALWTWKTPAVAFFVLAIMAIIPALAIHPVAGEEQLYLGTFPWGSECGFVTRFGIPCAACGMTRSWVHAARGHLFTAFAYNPAGAMLFVWIVFGGALSALRLALRRRVMVIPIPVVLGLVAVWTCFYLGMWVLRTQHIFPLPS